MNDAQRQELIDDFTQWAGGFPPESEHQITVYIDYAMDRRLNANEAREVMTDWMNSDDQVSGISTLNDGS